MAYLIQAIIAADTMLDAYSPSDVTLIVMPQNKAMIPLTKTLRQRYEIPNLPLTDEGNNGLSDSIRDFVAPLVGKGKFAYIEAEFFGGDGMQASVTWDDQGNCSVPLVDRLAIDAALKFLGVKIENKLDEFEALGLQKHRSTEDWENEKKLQRTTKD